MEIKLEREQIRTVLIKPYKINNQIHMFCIWGLHNTEFIRSPNK